MGNGTVNPLSGPQVTVPVLVSNSSPGGAINSPQQVTCGYQFGAALTTNGTVWTWGSGSHGELGNGTTGSSYSPAQVPGLTNITAISAGWFHILALKSDGTVWAWGNNSNGELGDGTTSNRSSRRPGFECEQHRRRLRRRRPFLGARRRRHRLEMGSERSRGIGQWHDQCRRQPRARENSRRTSSAPVSATSSWFPLATTTTSPSRPTARSGCGARTIRASAGMARRMPLGCRRPLADS